MATRYGIGGGAAASLAEALDDGPTPSVLVVGRHHLFTEALAVNLSEAGFEIVGTVSDVASMGHAWPMPPDVGVVDLGPRDDRALSAGRRLLNRWSGMKLLALTPDDHFPARAALTEGYHGCLSKEAPLSRLAASIREVFAGDMVMLDDLAPGRRAGNGSRESGARARTLTPRELDVLALLVQGRRSAEIAQALNIGLNTVRTHVQNILTKLHVHSRLEAASVAVKNGLVPLRRGARPLIWLR